jgi:hypothetical protein
MRKSVTLMCALLLASCSRQSGSPVLGNPVGVRLEGNGSQRDLEMAVALTGGQGDPTPGQVGAALAAARKACPGLSELDASGELIRIALPIRDGKLRAPPAPPVEALAACVAQGMGGAAMGPAAADGVDAVVELRVAQSLEVR